MGLYVFAFIFYLKNHPIRLKIFLSKIGLLRIDWFILEVKDIIPWWTGVWGELLVSHLIYYHNITSFVTHTYYSCDEDLWLCNEYANITYELYVDRYHPRTEPHNIQISNKADLSQKTLYELLFIWYTCSYSFEDQNIVAAPFVIVLVILSV